jgi:hypothetical protein
MNNKARRRLPFRLSAPVAVIELVDRDRDAKGKDDLARHEANRPVETAEAAA